MDKLFPKLRLICDFNASNLAGYLRKDLIGTTVEVAPFGQVMPQLIEAESDLWQGHSDSALVWTQPENVVDAFREALEHRPFDIEAALSQVDRFTASLLSFSRRVKLLCVPTWLAPGNHRGLGILDMKVSAGIHRLLMQMNLRLAQQLEQAPNIFVLDAQRWLTAVGRNAFSPKLWYMAKIPFGNELFKEAAADIAACLDGLAGKTKKLLVLDLDDTLWGGIVGDVGWEQIRVGGHDYVGEAYADFQRALKALTRRGVLLAVVSKNEEKVALQAIRSHPEMVLKLEDLAGWKINWNDKAQNVVELASQLNLGLQSVVFIDDNPVERARVREALPEVLVPEWPADCLLYTSALHGLRCFDSTSLSAEDAQRTTMYVSERQRSELKEAVSSIDEWLHTLEVIVEAEELNAANLERAAQLFNKTNQMNLSTRRLSSVELSAWLAGNPSRQLWTFRVSDRFGNSGLTGIASLECEAGTARIVDFLLSCRVMGRKVEEAMLHIITQQALAAGAASVRAEYIRTLKNQPCLDFWTRSGLKRHGDTFVWDNDAPYPAPSCIGIRMRELVHT